MTVPRSQIHGPGIRYVIWVQGCSIHCEGCANTELWPHEGGVIWPVEDLAASILDTTGIDGLTITGGEPLDQVDAVRELIDTVKRRGISVVLYTGHERQQIANDPRKEAVFSACDMAIVGPFDVRKKSHYLRWRGSSNQQFFFNNPAFETQVKSLPDDVNEIEIHIQADGSMIIAGYPEKEKERLVENAKQL